jgi:hypothetical protein
MALSGGSKVVWGVVVVVVTTGCLSSRLSRQSRVSAKVKGATYPVVLLSDFFVRHL